MQKNSVNWLLHLPGQHPGPEVVSQQVSPDPQSESGHLPTALLPSAVVDGTNLYKLAYEETNKMAKMNKTFPFILLFVFVCVLQRMTICSIEKLMVTRWACQFSSWYTWLKFFGRIRYELFPVRDPMSCVMNNNKSTFLENVVVWKFWSVVMVV